MKKRRRRGGYKRGTHISTKTTATCKYRSGWELAYMQYLDKNPDVIEWSYEELKIPYLSNKSTGKLRNYIPDFKVKYTNGEICLIEIKPKKKLNQLSVKKKIDAAIEWCNAHGMSFRVVTEIELKALQDYKVEILCE